MSPRRMNRFRRYSTFLMIIGVFFILGIIIQYYYTHEEVKQQPITTTTTTTDGGLLPLSTLDILKDLIPCHERDNRKKIIQRSDFWILYNFISGQKVDCHKGATFVTYGDFRVMKHLLNVAHMWNNPISVALYAPGYDFDLAMKTIRYMRDCTKSDLIAKHVTFHVFFPVEDFPKTHVNPSIVLGGPYICPRLPPYEMEKTDESVFPINSARNIAKEGSMTYFNLVSDVEFYPNYRLAERFLDMIAAEGRPIDKSRPTVYPLRVFQVDLGAPLPIDKNSLLRLVHRKKAQPHPRDSCPDACETWWNVAEIKLDVLKSVHVAKRNDGLFDTWKPIFIGTEDDPQYDERLPWEGQFDHASQWYVFCRLDYDMVALNDAFVVTHKTPIRAKPQGPLPLERVENNGVIRDIVMSELMSIYGDTSECY